MHGSIRKSLCAATLAALGTTPALAITSGDLDGNGHPFVGLMVAKDAAGTPLWRCSGTLLSPTIFLTAGHCTEAPAASAEVWFDPDMQTNSAAKGYPFTGEAHGTVHQHPNYNPDAFFLFDLGVVRLSAPVVKSQYGQLPAQDVLDVMDRQRGQQDVTFTAVGYGLQEAGPKPKQDLALKLRMIAHPKLNQINTGAVGDFSLLLSNNNSTGGTCFGDSGGPNFIGTSNVLAGVTSYGKNGNCGGTGGVYRVDRADDLNWLFSAFGSEL